MHSIITHNGTITITSLKTGQHRVVTIKTIQKGKNAGNRITTIRRSVNDVKHYGGCSYNNVGFGTITDQGTIRLWPSTNNPFFAKIADMITDPQKYQDTAVFQFEGKCRICNADLTNPESIESGIGPVCKKSPYNMVK